MNGLVIPMIQRLALMVASVYSFWKCMLIKHPVSLTMTHRIVVTLGVSEGGETFVVLLLFLLGVLHLLLHDGLKQTAVHGVETLDAREQKMSILKYFSLYSPESLNISKGFTSQHPKQSIQYVKNRKEASSTPFFQTRESITK